MEAPSSPYIDNAGAFSNPSDRNLKENFRDLNGEDILGKINDLNIQSWNYKSQGTNITHIGPVAQDFYQAFHLGDSNKSISTIDPAGIALVGVQALSKRMSSLSASTTVALSSLDLRLSYLGSLEHGTSDEITPVGNLWQTLESFGSEIIDGIAYLKNVFVEHLTAKTITIEKGFEIKSENGTIYCITIDNDGEFQREEGGCADLPAESEDPPSDASSTPPVIDATSTPQEKNEVSNPGAIDNNPPAVEEGSGSPRTLP